MTDIKSMSLSEMEEDFQRSGEKKYRAAQVFSWLHKGAASFDDMTDLSLELRDKLSRQYYITVPVMLEKHISESDGTIKYLWGMSKTAVSDIKGSDYTYGDTVESVLMDYKHGTTICISTQVGCKMGCVFCASGINGFMRNLTPSEMLDQVFFSTKESGKKISNIVLMGIGEPLDNFDNVVRFISLVCHHKGLNIGARHITLSTCGVIENIDRMADIGVQLSLAVSLHAPDDDTRTKLIPHNRSTGIKALFEAAGRYNDKTGRRVTYEYAMIDGVNDSPEQAKLLAELLRGTGSHLNLIMLSTVPECGYKASTKENLDRFTGVLLKNGVSFTTRRSLGTDIEASCGQLRRKKLVINGVMGHNSQR